MPRSVPALRLALSLEPVGRATALVHVQRDPRQTRELLQRRQATTVFARRLDVRVVEEQRRDKTLGLPGGKTDGAAGSTAGVQEKLVHGPIIPAGAGRSP